MCLCRGEMTDVDPLPHAETERSASRRRLLIEPRRPAWLRGNPRAYWYVVGTVCIGAFMGQLDASIVTLALPRIERDLHATVGAVEWVALSYLLVLVATVAIVGRIADAVGRKLLYVYGFGVFTVGSAFCALAPTLALLIAARVLQAIGAAMLQANSVALITEAMPRPAARAGDRSTGHRAGARARPRASDRRRTARARRLATDLPREPAGWSDRAPARLVPAAAQPLPSRRGQTQIGSAPRFSRWRPPDHWCTSRWPAARATAMPSCSQRWRRDRSQASRSRGTSAGPRHR